MVRVQHTSTYTCIIMLSKGLVSDKLVEQQVSTGVTQ